MSIPSTLFPIEQDYVKNLLAGVQHLTFVARDEHHSVVSVPNNKVMENVIDQFKQKSGISFASYRKPKDFGERGNWKNKFRDQTRLSLNAENKLTFSIPGTNLQFQIFRTNHPCIWKTGIRRTRYRWCS